MKSRMRDPNVYTEVEYFEQRDGVNDARQYLQPRSGTFWYLFGYFHTSIHSNDQNMHHDDAALAATLADPHTVPAVLRRSLLDDYDA